ncbi:DASS family sodium-coupled anion symporter [Desulfosporosinus sp.]|uniref:SLC13 family permease n=1 Tax=Desulfosporosinus sp. TaxID=157907 RepID=UPI00231F2275|nr:DASS family sodium-coupled anion symporter [Desulfosporosinus sp.]MDA8224016.1 DASS family sodium-coupled anion symporter [Desulfitobacterium hafniense]
MSTETKMNTEPKGNSGMSVTMKRAITLIGLVLLYFILAKLPIPTGLKPEGQIALALMVVVVLTWVTEAIPIAISSLFFVFIQHVIGIAPMPVAVANFANPTLLFVISSFFLAIALSESGLSNRMSMKMTVLSKGSPKMVLLYLMMSTALLSTVISDVPACAAFFTIGLALLQKNNCKIGFSSFAKSLMIGIPFASLIGGVATPAGSSLNVLTLSLLKSTANIDISFLQWSAVGIPAVIVTIPLAWLILSWVFPSELDRLVGIEEIQKDLHALGPVSSKEIKFVIILIVMLITWFTEPFHKIPLPVTSTIGAALFFLPGIDLLTWDAAKNRIGWDGILLIGAASSLGTTLWKSGGANWLANMVLGGIADSSSLVMIISVIVFTVLIHLLVPVNPAIVSIMVPTLVAFAATTGIAPVALVVPMGFTVSAAFLLPLDPVPLITYPEGYYKMTDYFKGGAPLCIVWTIVITLVMILIAQPMRLF